VTKRSGRRARARALEIAESTAALKPEVSPDATLGPEASFEITRFQWMGPESTTAPAIGEEDREPEYAAGGYELFDKFLQGRLPLLPQALLLIITVIWFAFISFLFIKDNELGRLDTIDGMKWFGTKVIVYSIPYVIVAFLIWIASKPLRKGRARPRKPGA
jgi:hypothetical protein